MKPKTRRKRTRAIDWKGAREQWSSTTPMSKEERLAVLRIRVQTALADFIVCPDHARHGVVNIAVNALALEWGRP